MGVSERRLLQAAIILACVVPIGAGAAGMINGPGHAAAGSVDLDSHFRYLSGLLFGLGLGFLSCVPRIEQQGSIFRLLGLMVIVGGLARLGAALFIGWPGPAHIFALVMELGIVPSLMLWQYRVARIWSKNSSAR